MNVNIQCVICLLVCVFLQSASSSHHHHAWRMTRDAKKKDCQYEKGEWSPCDPKSGQQKRTLKLVESEKSSSEKCKLVKEMARSCKPACRYEKGTWTECSGGVQTRIDSLKDNSNGNGCEATRPVQRPCKQSCKYSKGDWSPCDESGVKRRTLTRINGDGPQCEETKFIVKQCGNGTRRSKQGKVKNRNKTNVSVEVSSSSQPIENQ